MTRSQLAPALYGPGGRVPLKPFCGTIGLAPAEAGLAFDRAAAPRRRQHGHPRHDARAPSSTCRSRSQGGLFSVGDTHAAQGDGEVCGTAIESPCSVAAKFDLVKGANLAFPRFTTPGPVTRHLDAKGYEVTTGIGPDLMEGAKAAVSGMIDLLSQRYSMNPVEAYMLCASAATCASARSSTCRTGWCPSTSRVSSSNERLKPLLRVEDLTVGFSTEQGPVRVVEDVSFSLAAGRDAGPRRRVRLRQERDRPDHHAPAAKPALAHRDRPDPVRRRGSRGRIAESACRRSAATASA